LFALVWDAASKKLHGLNASGRSPLSLSLERLLELRVDLMPERGALAVNVPGAVDGWCELHARFGRLPLADLLAPSIAHAREGFPVTEVIGAAWAAGARALQSFPGFADVFMPRGRAPAVGEPFANSGLARAYELIANEGRAAFYDGAIAAAIEECVRGNGGYLGREDLRAHHSEWVEPVATTYRGWRVFELPPNGQGLAVLQMLNILEGFELGSLTWGGAEHLHLFIEAKKLAFEDRAKFYADPAFAAVPIERLASKAYAAARRALIDPQRAAPAPTHGDARAGAGDTVYLATADADGNMVSLIQSNYMGFGSGVTVAPFGFGLQNRGSQFALDASHANAYAPGKRPFHTIIPGVRDEGRRSAARVRRHGRGHAAARPGAGAHEHARFRARPTGRRRRTAGAARGLDGADGRAAAGARRHRASRARLHGGGTRRPAGARPSHRAQPRPRAVRRLSSDPPRSAPRRLPRRVGVAQGRPRGGVLRGAGL
jgi:gamma-glutamyltranspeptidase/glutathione hydrolase